MMAQATEALNDQIQLIALKQSPPKRLADLDDDCLSSVFDRLPADELFKLLRVNKRWNRLANDMIRFKIKAIALYKSSNSFADCDHLNDVNQNQVLVLEALFGKQFGNEFFQEPSKRFLFFRLLGKCEEVKSIDFDNFTVTGDLLLEMVQNECCPKLECVKIHQSVVNEDEWQLVLDKIGHRMVHFVNKNFSKKPMQVRLLEIIAEKCPKMSKIDWHVKHRPETSGLFAAIETLPTSCWVKLGCNALSEDVVNEFSFHYFNWSTLKNRYDKLSSLKLTKIWPEPDSINGVDFAGLKKLDLIDLAYPDSIIVLCLSASRFPRLEEFRFNPSCGLTEDDFEALFRKMATVKKLTIYSNSYHYSYKLPDSAIFHLKNLDTIYFNFFLLDSGSWRYVDFLRKIEQYVKRSDR